MDVDDEKDIHEYTRQSSNSKWVYVTGGVVFVLVVAAVFTLFFVSPWSSDDDDETGLQKKYQSSVTTILDLAMKDTQGYIDLSEMVNKFGNRMTGSSTLNDVSEWAKKKLEDDGFSKVAYETVDAIPAWKHNPEGDLLVMTSPYYKKLGVLPLGASIPAHNVTGEVIVLTSDEDLNSVDVTDKIVVWNVPFTTYSDTVKYRTNGARMASENNAKASLTRSITPSSLFTPHTGIQSYGNANPIPAAAITVEDAELFSYIQNVLQQTIIIELTLDVSDIEETVPGQNIVAELTGSEIPEEILVIGGHIDSWDVGTGAHDDAGGIWHCWQALRILKDNGFIPKRTIRLVMWTAEENGGAGNQAYFNQHLGEYKNTVFALESDGGTLTPNGWSFQGNQSGMSTVQEISDMMSPTLSMNVYAGSAGADVDLIISQGGVPGVGLSVEGDRPNKYFYYHHTNADTMDHIDQDDFRKCVGAVASLVYVIADMDQTLPRME